MIMTRGLADYWPKNVAEEVTKNQQCSFVGLVSGFPQHEVKASCFNRGLFDGILEGCMADKNDESIEEQSANAFLKIPSDENAVGKAGVLPKFHLGEEKNELPVPAGMQKTKEITEKIVQNRATSKPEADILQEEVSDGCSPQKKHPRTIENDEAKIVTTTAEPPEEKAVKEASVKKISVKEVSVRGREKNSVKEQVTQRLYRHALEIQKMENAKKNIEKRVHERSQLSNRVRSLKNSSGGIQSVRLGNRLYEQGVQKQKRLAKKVIQKFVPKYRKNENGTTTKKVQKNHHNARLKVKSLLYQLCREKVSEIKDAECFEKGGSSTASTVSALTSFSSSFNDPATTPISVYKEFSKILQCEESQMKTVVKGNFKNFLPKACLGEEHSCETAGLSTAPKIDTKTSCPKVVQIVNQQQESKSEKYLKKSSATKRDEKPLITQVVLPSTVELVLEDNEKSLKQESVNRTMKHRESPSGDQCCSEQADGALDDSKVSVSNSSRKNLPDRVSVGDRLYNLAMAKKEKKKLQWESDRSRQVAFARMKALEKSTRNCPSIKAGHRLYRKAVEKMKLLDAKKEEMTIGTNDFSTSKLQSPKKSKSGKDAGIRLYEKAIERRKKLDAMFLMSQDSKSVAHRSKVNESSRAQLECIGNRLYQQGIQMQKRIAEKVEKKRSLPTPKIIFRARVPSKKVLGINTKRKRLNSNGGQSLASSVSA